MRVHFRSEELRIDLGKVRKCYRQFSVRSLEVPFEEASFCLELAVSIGLRKILQQGSPDDRVILGPFQE